MQMKLYDIGSEEIYPLRRHYSCVKEQGGGEEEDPDPGGPRSGFSVATVATPPRPPGKYDNACGDDKTNGFHYSRIAAPLSWLTC